MHRRRALIERSPRFNHSFADLFPLVTIRIPSLPSLALAALLAAGLSACAGGSQVRGDAPAADVPAQVSEGEYVVDEMGAGSAADAGIRDAQGAGGVAATYDAGEAETAVQDSAGQPYVADADDAAVDATTPHTLEPTQAELDYALIYGEPYNPVADPSLPPSAQMPASYDPWEPFNRRMHRFNNAVDRNVALPLARGYVKVVPRPVRLGVSNFFSNLGQPVSAVNALLQGKPGQAAQSLGRFLLNVTLGIGGIFDPATDANIPHRSEDFGQTLGVWGWENSRYLELPLFGPRTLRDAFGLVGDAPLSPTRQIDDDAARIGLQGLQLVEIRTQLMAVDRMRQGAADEYALVRDAWLQRRNYQIHGDRTQADDEYLLPDYLLDDEANPTVPADAIPVPIPD